MGTEDNELCLLRKKNEENLKEIKKLQSEVSDLKQFYYQITKNINDVIWIYNFNKNAFTYVSPSVITLRGITAEEVLKEKMEDFLSPESLVIVSDLIDTIKYKINNNEDIEPITLEVEQLHKNKSKILTELKCNFYKNGNNETEVIGTSRDITVRKRYETKLAESETLFRTISENTSDGIVVFDSNSKLKYASPSYLKLLGYDENEELKREVNEIFTLIHPEDREDLYNLLVQNIEKQTDQLIYQYRIKHKKGHYIWREANAKFSYKDGKYNGSYIICRDITERKRLEEEVETQKENYKLLFETIEDLVYVVSDEMEILYVNNAFKEKLKYDDTELHGLKITDLYKSQTSLTKNEYYTQPDFNSHDEQNLILMSKSGNLIYSETKIRPGQWDGKKSYFVISKDLTKEKENLHKFNSIFTYNPLLMALTDYNTHRFVNVNNSFLNVLGFEKDEVIDKTPSELKTFIDETAQKKVAGELARNGSIKNVELKVKTKSGKILDGLFSGEIIEIDGNKYYLTVMADITHQKEMEKMLSDYQSKLQSAMNIANIATWEYDITIEKFVFNDNFYSLYATSAEKEGGYFISPQDYINKFIHPDDVDRVAEEIQKASKDENEKIKYLEHKIIRRDGQTRTITVQYFSVKDEKGNFVKRYGANQDVTERVRGAELLKAALERNKAILSANPDLMFVFDRNYRIIDCNPRTKSEQLLFDPQIFLDKPVDEVLPSNLVELTYRNIDSVLKNEQSSFDNYSLSINGKEEYFESRYVKCGNDEVLAIVRNITESVLSEKEKERLQNELIQSSKLDSIGRLAGGIAHDFNNILSVILGNCELALLKLKPDDDISKIINDILFSAEKSAALVKQLLGFARKQSVKPEIVCINECVENMLKIIHKLIGENINLSLVSKKDIWDIYIDPTQIDQILINLCANSRDSIINTGSISIETQNVSVTRQIDSCREVIKFGDYVRLSIKDSGKGMTAEMLEKVFEPFYTTKELGKGTGLGLATVYGIVKQNKGYIWIESQPEKGTSVNIIFPRYFTTGQNDKSVKTEKTLPKGNELILLVEDDITLAELNKTILENFGYTVISCHSPKEAIKKIKKGDNNFSLLITDIIMPEMNGKEMVEKIKKILPDIKTIFVSGYTSDIVEHKMLYENNSTFIQKPFSMKEILNKVRLMLDGKND